MRIMKSLSTALLLGVCTVPLVQCHGSTTVGGSSGTARRYLTASQHKDFKTIIDLTATFQDSVKNIKSSNPKVLWAKLIGQYYDELTRSLAQQAPLIPPSAQWAVTEQRPGQANQTTVYVTVHYATPSDSPVVGQQRLKQSILQLTIFNPTQQVLGVSRVEAADVYWPIPSLSNEEAVRLIKAQLPATELAPHLVCNVESPARPGQMPYCGIGLPYNTTPRLSEYTGFLEQHGFVVRPFKMREGWGANGTWVQPPPNWSSLILSGDGDPRSQAWDERAYNISNSHVDFKLSESTSLNIIGIEQKPGYAKVSLHLIYSGCTAACSMLREFWAKGGNNYFGAFTDRFFTPNLYGAGDPGAKWPVEEDRSIEFSWDPVALSWYVSKSTRSNLKF